MPLWYRKINSNNYSTIDLVAEFLDIWLQTRRSEDISPEELAGVIDVMYDVQTPPGNWSLIEVRPGELRNYIQVYIKPDGRHAPMMSKRDEKLSGEYKNLLQKGYKPTPIIIAGTEGDNREEGIFLIDGRHRIHSAADLGIQKMEAYIPTKQINTLRKARLT
jgi:hypothetical protein